MERQAEGPLSFYQRFLRITSPYFPLFLRARSRTHTHLHAAHMERICIYPRVLFPFCPPPRLRRPLVSILFHPPRRSPFCLFSSFRTAFRPLRRYCTYVVYNRVCVSQSSYARFHVARALRSRGERAALYVGERENVF